MEEEDDIFENRVEFVAERGVWDRVGGIDIGLGLGGPINLKKSGYTDIEKFKLIVVATINIINDLDGAITLNIDEITHVLGLVERIPDFQFKNPPAFVLGYMVASQSNYDTIQINQNVLSEVLEINLSIQNQLFSKVEDVDIIRYARLCLINKLK